jgi:repressor LexA
MGRVRPRRRRESVLLTQRQLQLLTYIHSYVREHRVPPSFEEMRNALELKSKSGVHRLVEALEERGYIRRLAYRARALEIVRSPYDDPSPDFERPAGGGAQSAPPAPEATVGDLPSNIVRGHFPAGPRSTGSPAGGNRSVPLVGRIAAGSPIEALADHGNAIEVPNLLLGEGEHYVLQVSGDSMADAGIVDGDYAVIQRCETAENGTIVVALIEDREVTLKRLRRKGASIALEPANAAYETRIFGPHQVQVQGRLVGLLRRY